MERVLMYKANYLAEVSGYEVCIITSEQKGRSSFFPFSPKIRFIDLGVNYEDDQNRSLWIRLLLKRLKMIKHRKRLNSLLHKELPDICISMFDRDMGFLYKINDGSKKILEYHFSKNVKLIEARNGVLRFLQRIRIAGWRRVVQKYDRFVVLTEEDRKAWGNIHNICVIPNFLTGLPPQVSSLTEKRVLGIGRLCYQKGFDYLVKSWEIVHKHFPEWKLYIYGDGEKREELSLLVERYGLKGCVFLMPATMDIGKEYMHSSVYVMTSRYEGLPMVLLEAMSYGLPVVSFACPCGPSDLIDDSVGCLVPVGDTVRLSEKLMNLLADEEKRAELGRNARAIATHYLQPEVMKMWDELFCSVLL